jgi:hypothetical protein
MTTSEQGRVSSATPEMSQHYEEAETVPSEGQKSCTSSVEAGIPLANIVFASSTSERREVKVEPDRIKRSLEALEKNRRLQIKGLG